MKNILYFGFGVMMAIVSLVVPSVSVHTAYAQGVQKSGIVPCGTSTTPDCTIGHFFVLIALITNFLITLAGAYAVFMLIVSGIRLVVSRGDQGMATKAKNGLTNAIIGFILVMIAYAAVNTFVYKIFGVNGASLIGNPFNVQLQ